MTFVVDASVALSWVFRDEATPGTDNLLDSFGDEGTAIVPSLWRWEIANAFLTAVRKSRLTQAEASACLSTLQMLPIQTDDAAIDEAWSATMALAEKHGLTSYDAAYLAVALRRGLPLASLYNALRTAAIAEHVSVFPTDRAV